MSGTYGYKHLISDNTGWPEKCPKKLAARPIGQVDSRNVYTDGINFLTI